MQGLVVCLLYTERISSRYQALNARLAGETRASFVNMHEAHHKNYCHRRFGCLHDVMWPSYYSNINAN